MKNTRFIVPAIALILPGMAWAATTNNLHGVVSLIASYLNDALGLLMGVAVVIFVFYVIRYFIQPNDKRAEAAQYIMWSLIGFFIILSFWGIVNIFRSTFDFGQNSPGSWGDFKDIFPK
jgi:hypothetical protein